MANHDLVSGGVVLGAPTLTVNPPAKPEEKAKQASPEKAPKDDDDSNAAHQDDG